MASIGSSAPETNDTAEVLAAWTGLGISAGSMCSSASRCAAKAPRSVSSVATVRAVAAERPLASYRAVSSVSSASGDSASSRFSWRDLRALAVALAGDRHVLTQRHRHGTGDQPGQSGGEDGAAGGGRPGHADDDACHRHDPVVGPQHPGPQPVQPPCGSPGMRFPGVSCAGRPRRPRPEQQRAWRHQHACLQ